MTKKIDWLIITEKADQARQFEKGLSLVNGKTPYLDGTVAIVHARGRLLDFSIPDVQNKKRYGRDVIDNKPKSVFTVSNDKHYRSDVDRLANMPVYLNTRADGKMLLEFNDANAAQLGDDIVTRMHDSLHIIVATDWDVEGELLFYDLVSYYELRDKLDWSSIYRLHYQSLDAQDIRSSLKEMQSYGDPDGSNIPEVGQMIAQGYARSIADYEVGYTFSFYNEVLKRQLGLQFEGGLGRLKLAVMHAIQEREVLVKTQDLRNKYGIQLILPDDSRILLPDEFTSIEEANVRIGSYAKNVSIRVQTGEKRTLAPKLYTRTNYTIDMDKLHGGSDWGRPLQLLYETHGLVSYPRTASSYLNMRQFERLRDLVMRDDVQSLLQQRVQERGYDKVMFDKLKPRHKYVNLAAAKAAAHHAIVPVDLPDEALAYQLIHDSGRASKAYDSILYRSAAIFAENGIDNGQLVTVYDTNGQFIAEQLNQRTVTLGWRKLIDGPVFNDVFYTGGVGEQTVSYEVVLLPNAPKLLFTYPTLLAYLNEHDIGTESTREPVLADLKFLKMISVDKAGFYTLSKPIGDILRIVDQEGWLRSLGLLDWDSRIQRIETMSDAMKFLQVVRERLAEVNLSFKRWYDNSQD